MFKPIRGKIVTGTKGSLQCIVDSGYLLLNASFETKMVINRYLRGPFGHKKVIVEILRSSFIGRLTLCTVQGGSLPESNFIKLLTEKKVPF